MSSPHATLTAAANKIRQMADEATPDDEVFFIWREDAAISGASRKSREDSALVRLGSPDMWRLIADWLDAEAKSAEDITMRYATEDFIGQFVEHRYGQALAVASAVLGKGEDDD